MSLQAPGGEATRDSTNVCISEIRENLATLASYGSPHGIEWLNRDPWPAAEAG
jgi:hypothetical protein